MEASGNSNTKLPKAGCDTGPREGYKCLDVWTDPCHYREPWKPKITQRVTAYDTTPTELPQERSGLTTSWPGYLLTQISLQRQFKCLPTLWNQWGASGERKLWSSPAQGVDTWPLLLQPSLTLVVLFKHKFGCTRRSQMHGNINMQWGAGQCWAVLRAPNWVWWAELFQLI